MNELNIDGNANNNNNNRNTMIGGRNKHAPNRKKSKIEKV